MLMRRDVAEFSEYVAQRWASLVRTAYLLTGDNGHAEDLVQTALAKCYVAWPRLRAHDAPDAYVRKALLNTYISWRRKKSWHEMPSEDPPEPEGVDSTDDLARRSVILDALTTLPPKQRAVVVLRFYEDQGIHQVAQQLGCSTGSVKRQTHEALRKLRTTLGEDLQVMDRTTFVEGGTAG
jgi:RNA polymerase sigma-70 factor (sigma-E family)